MKIVLPLAGAPSLELASDVSAKQAGEALAAHPDVIALAKETGRTSHYRAFEANELDDHTARRIAKIHCSDGDGESLIYDLGLRNDEETYFEEVVEKDFNASLEKLADEIVNALPELDLDVDEIVEAAGEALKETVLDAMSDANDSGPLDAIQSHQKVEVAFLMNLGLGVDEAHTRHIDIVSSVGTIEPNVAFLNLLKLVNVSVSEFIEMAKADGYDLLTDEPEENASEYRRQDKAAIALQWRAVLGLETGDLTEIRKLPLQGKYEIAEWNARVDLVRTLKDYSRPAALTAENLLTVINEASYGGAATYVARLPLKALLEGAYDQPFLATGGFVGLHHFGNGSGYIERPDAPVLIDPISAGGFFVQKTSKDAVDDVYGFVPSYLNIRSADPHRTNWRQTKDGAWRIEGPKNEDGEDTFYALVTKGEIRDGAEEFWVQTRSYDDACPAGPFETSEVFTSIADAQAAGEAALKEPAAAAAPAP